MSDISRRIEKAEKTLQKGKPELALDEYLSILDDEPGNEAVCHTAADLCVSLGRNSEAARLLGNLFDRQCAADEKARAAVTYKKLARIGKPSGDQSLRFAEELAKNAKDALKAYDAALQSFLSKKRTSEALTALKGIVRLEPSIENFRKLGEVAAQAGDHETASGAYVSAGDLENDESAKLALYQRACEIAPEDINPALKCAEGLLALGNAESAANILRPFIAAAQCDWTVRTLYGKALLSSGQAREAAPLVWDSYERDSSSADDVARVIELLAREDQVHAALEWSRRLERKEQAAGRRRDFVAVMKGITDKLPPNVEFLEYMAEVFNLANREHDYCETLLKLFDLLYAAGNFRSAAECLDRAAEVDAYEPGHQLRLEMLRGKIAARQYQAIAERLSVVLGSGAGAAAETKVAAEPESTALDDLMVQAQIYLRYSMVTKAREKLARIQALYPGQEINSPDLRELYASAGMQLTSSKTAQPVRDVAPRAVEQAEPEHQARQALGVGTDEIGRISAITRNLYRQNSVNAVLFAAVNDLGRYWSASRCIAVLCTPGKPPSIAMEYCAPGLRQSDIHAIVKLVGLLQPLAVAHGTLEISVPRKTKPMLKPLRKSLGAMGIESLLAVPLLDGDDHIGLLALTECDTVREWSDTDAELLRTMSEQAVLAVHNVRLRRLVTDLAVTEEKSGLVKRSSYMDVALAEVTRGQRHNSPVSVMLMNMGSRDELAEQIGTAGLESMMRHTAQLVTSNVRQNDIAVRYDATTIAVILADTPEANAVQAAEKLRRVAAVAALPGQDHSNISIGVAQALINTAFDPGDIVTELVNRADRALSEAVTTKTKTRALAAPMEYCAASA